MSKLKKGIGFFSEVNSELKKVTWPTKENTLKHLTVVFAFIIIMMVFLGTIDYLFTYMVSFFIK